MQVFGMALEVLKCSNCGAKVKIGVGVKSVACSACGRPVRRDDAKSSTVKSVAAPSAAAKAIAAKPVAAGVPGTAKVSVAAKAIATRRGEDDEEVDDEENEEFEWNEECLSELAQERLGEFESLYYDPKIPRDRLKTARNTHNDHLEDNERILVLYDDSEVGGTDDGFIITTDRFAWKNSGSEVMSFLWEEIDPEEIEYTEDGLTVMGEEVHIAHDSADELYATVGEFIIELSTLAAELAAED
jgi:DNA-directed RNA polymerase subunit RPC12/RpoP